MSHLPLAIHIVFAATGGPTADWPTYGNDPGGMRYSPLTQIDRDNVTKLRVAWTYHTGDVADGSQTPVRSAFEATPIVVDHTMYFSTPFDRVIALDPETGRERWAYDPKIDRALPYGDRREPLVTPNLGVCNPPAWGALSAIDLSSGKLRWEVPLGTMPEATNAPGAERLGSLNLGGPITTASGLIFIGAARDNFLRAFDIGTGKELWKGELPASPQATPMTYQLMAGGKQYVVIAAGGHGKLRTKLGDTLVAFALP